MDTTKLSLRDKNLISKTSCGIKVTPEIKAPALPHTIKDYVYNSYTIITTGTVELNGIAVPSGTYSFGGDPKDVIGGMTLTTSSGGSVVIISTKRTNK